MIEFETHDVEMPDIDIKKVTVWIQEVAASHSRSVGNLNYLFVGDEEILDANRRFVNHDYFTDIITFDYSRGRMVSGDMFISLDTVLSNSELVGATYERELLRVIIHGVLHLCGINDKGPGEREIMESFENQALALLDEIRKELL